MSLRRTLLVVLSVLAMVFALAGPSAAQPATAAPPPDPGPSTTVTAGNTELHHPSDDFEKKKLTADVGEPMALAVLPDARVLMTDRRGVVSLFDPVTYNVVEAGRIAVYTGEEDGLQGIAIDPAFAENHWVYVYYSPAGPEPKNRLARFKLEGNALVPASEQVIIEVTTQRDLCCHVGGDIDFDAAGNLYLSTGDNTNSWASDGYTPIDEREGRSAFDAQRSSANTNDLRGKLLRIKMQEDGSYTIPDGNLFAPGTEKTRPEIYYMGLRNPFRFSVDKKTGWVYIGVVGPDASADNPDRGPRQYDELLLIKEPGNSGWPYCIADDIPYNDFDFATGTSGPKFDCDKLVNDSPNNTGLTDLPPSDDPLIWYPYACFDKFPQIDCPGGGTAMGGPVYRFDPNLESNTKFPADYDGAEFFYEYSRGFVKTVRTDDQGALKSIDPFLAELDFNQPMDMEFGPEGSLYVLEYGGGFFTPGPYAGLYRIDYTQGQHSPTATVTATPTSGDAPLQVGFDASKSADADGDAISFAWDFNGDGVNDAEGPTASHAYGQNGSYSAKLTVTDDTGRFSVVRVDISVGNHAPEVVLEFPDDGATFSFGDEVSYRVKVTDAEDGTIGNGVDCSAVQVQLALGHDSHAHPQSNKQGCEGVIKIQEEAGHGGDANLFTVLRASYADKGGQDVGSASGTHEIILQPKHKQAEHHSRAQGVQVTADEQAEGRNLVGGITGGDWISFDPLSLQSVDTVSFRAKTTGVGGGIELRQGAPDGPVLGKAEVPAGTAGSFVDIAPIPVTDPGGSMELFAVFTGADNAFGLDSLKFNGLGATGPLNVHATSDVKKGSVPLDVTFRATATPAPAGAKYTWDFGDGTTGTGAEAKHTYAATGDYTAKVTLTDANGKARGTASAAVGVVDPVRGAVAVTPESAELPAGTPHEVTAKFTPESGSAAGQPVTVEVYRKSEASPLPPGLQGTPYLRAERKVLPADDTGTVKMPYTSTVASTDLVVACAAYGDSCGRGDGTLAVTDQGAANLRTDVAVDTAGVVWSAKPDADGFVNLFDGQTLAGWDHAGNGRFEVTNGLLQPRGGYGNLWYADQQFTDYVLEADYESFDVSANSGLYQRFDNPGAAGREGYEVAILDRVDNQINRTGSLSGVKAATHLAAKPPYGGWNTFSIRVVGNTYTVTLNGQVVTEYTGDGSRGTGKRIGIENANDSLRFRNIKIKPLTAPDVTAPVSTASTQPSAPDGAQGWFVSGPVTVNLAATDPGEGASGVAGSEYRIGDGPWTAYTAPFAVTGEGAHAVQYRSKDKAGNVEEVRSLPVNIDTGAPSVTASFGEPGDGGWHDGVVELALSGEDGGSGLALVESSVDGGPWTPYTGVIPVRGDGQHTVLYRSVDVAGNVSAEKAATILIDATRPTLLVDGVANGRVYGDASDLVLSWRAEDASSGVASVAGTLNGQALSSGAYLPLHTLNLGLQQLSVVATDNAGNRTEQNLSFATSTSTRDLGQLIDRFRASNRLSLTAYTQLGDQLRKARLAEASGDDLATIAELRKFTALAGDAALVRAPDIRAVLTRDADTVITSIEGGQ
ncbi:OmpL47-type beta-barrel domain-containing protein [Amycolatopsis nigrescens]|uniref:OmpL47-type beta-barrel domain-containing protein n=1 Tax=Amycolatopsis nigrescens TaxID=381445 RepID=UPI0003A8A7EB|nr:PQQ-dependent sugar dehydrogenase [Amycolatopsis nigrescens]